jgi:hypothetical protein
VPAVVSVNTGQEGPNGPGNSCNYDLAAGKELLFYADGAGAAYTAGACNHPTEAGRGVLQRVESVAGVSVARSSVAGMRDGTRRANLDG